MVENIRGNMHSKEIRADYHFHPNLPKNEKEAARKISDIYRKMGKIGIEAIIVTEHVYKDYERAWRLMKKYKPKNISLFPGLEYTSKENIDICLFSETEKIYEHKFIPFQKTYEEIISFIKTNPEVVGFVTHPFTLGTTSLIDKKGEKFAKEKINILGSVEAAYTTFSELKSILKKTGLSKILTNLMNRIEKNETLPKEFYPSKIIFLAAGSDAHHVWEIGTYAKVKLENKSVFHSITNNKELLIAGERKSSPKQMIISLITIFRESCLKKLIRIRGWIS